MEHFRYWTYHDGSCRTKRSNAGRRTVSGSVSGSKSCGNWNKEYLRLTTFKVIKIKNSPVIESTNIHMKQIKLNFFFSRNVRWRRFWICWTWHKKIWWCQVNHGMPEKVCWNFWLQVKQSFFQLKNKIIYEDSHQPSYTCQEFSCFSWMHFNVLKLNSFT